MEQRPCLKVLKVGVKLEKESALKSLANYWRRQAEYWDSREKACHEAVLFCRQIKEEIRNKRKEVIKDGVLKM